jgi:hypothetical protein
MSNCSVTQFILLLRQPLSWPSLSGQIYTGCWVLPRIGANHSMSIGGDNSNQEVCMRPFIYYSACALGSHSMGQGSGCSRITNLIASDHVTTTTT